MVRAQDIEEMLEEAEEAIKNGDEASAGTLLDMAGEGLEEEWERLRLIDVRRGEILKALRNEQAAPAHETTRSLEGAMVHADRYVRN